MRFIDNSKIYRDAIDFKRLWSGAKRLALSAKEKISTSVREKIAPTKAGKALQLLGVGLTVFYGVRHILSSLKNGRAMDKASAAASFAYGYLSNAFPELKGQGNLDRLCSAVSQTYDEIEGEPWDLNNPECARMLRLSESLERELAMILGNSKALYEKQREFLERYQYGEIF